MGRRFYLPVRAIPKRIDRLPFRRLITLTGSLSIPMQGMIRSPAKTTFAKNSGCQHSSLATGKIIHPGQRRMVAEYDYRSESGELLFQVCRFEPKDFRQRRPD